MKNIIQEEIHSAETFASQEIAVSKTERKKMMKQNELIYPYNIHIGETLYFFILYSL